MPLTPTKCRGSGWGIPAGTILTRPSIPSTDFGTALSSKCHRKGPPRADWSLSPLFPPPGRLPGAAPRQRTLPSLGVPCMGWGLGPPWVGSREQAPVRNAEQQPGRLHLACPQQLSPFRACPQPVRQAAPPATGARAWEKQKGSSVGPRGEQTRVPEIAACGDPPPGPAAPARGSAGSGR